ncbi:hypothetical protein EUGRSUZ_C02302 [Eucalyptus grandis]|uniref:Uncharacterized protein n=2 Tax=Eucalyptus grandis TaxID=71139 RepID=A0ACC3LFU4_EUCGR|nr:hypothetical protein EUGRSUZ_C02302 [Eucalyptus grandis]
MKEFWTSLVSLLGVLASLMNILQVVLPPELWFAAFRFLNRALSYFSSYCYWDVTEIDGVNTNELYNAVQLYLSSFVSTSTCRLSLTRTINSSATTFGLSNDGYINDVFDGVAVQWEHVVQRQPHTFSGQRCFTLQIRKRDKNLILDSYLDYIMDKANDIRRKNQQRLIYTNTLGRSLDSRGQPWDSVPFKHPSNFDTLAMDPDRKRNIMEDLSNFTAGQALYRQTGGAWKRRYLLYGLPGTGKSSTIAAMANFLYYDIYVLELTQVRSKSELLNLLMKTSSKSIIVIEDIDRLVNLSKRSKMPQVTTPLSYYHPGSSDSVRSLEDGNNAITLWELLHFPDGLWSCCGSERIFIYTTSHFEKLDPALLESSRMDMQICMSQY